MTFLKILNLKGHKVANVLCFLSVYKHLQALDKKQIVYLVNLLF